MNALTTLTLLLVTTFYWTSAEDDPLEVLYKSETFTSSPGSSVKLTCQLHYDPVQCGQIHGVWFRLDPEFELTDPGKYSTIVNETITENNWRRRQVQTEILDLTYKDEGSYQCVAEADFKKAQKFMGHLITVIVKD